MNVSIVMEMWWKRQTMSLYISIVHVVIQKNDDVTVT